MNAKDPMSPDASPQRVPPGPGVRRVNDLPAYIVVTLMGLFLVIMALVAMDRSAKQKPGATVKDEKADNASRYAAAIVGDQKDGIIRPGFAGADHGASQPGRVRYGHRPP
jgi:type IV secretion system protein VirB10